MLTKTDLEEFERQLQSGAIDAEFKCANEQQRGELLELLEKIMDVADLADEVATRLIFRGRMQ